MKKYDINRTLSNGFLVINETANDIYTGPIFYRDTISNIYNTSLAKHYSYKSSDSDDWSPWIPISSYINPGVEEYNIRFKVDVISNIYNNVIEITGISLDGTLVIDSVNDCVPSKVESGITLRDDSCGPVNLNTGFDLYKDLETGINSMVYNTIGVDVVYISYDGRSNMDMILKEYTNLEFNKKDCIKVIVDGNKLPDIKPQFDEWGLDFDSFEVSVPVGTFKSKYGKNPAKGDVIIFHIYNRIYQVTSADLKRGINAQPVYWELSLKKYDIEEYREDDVDINKIIMDAVTTTDEIFGMDNIDENIEDVITPLTNVKPYLDFDDLRSFIHKDVEIISDDIYMGGTKYAGGYYRLSNVNISNVDSIVYKIDTNPTVKYSLIFGFSINSLDKSKYPSRSFDKSHVLSDVKYSHLFSMFGTSIWISFDEVVILGSDGDISKYMLDTELYADVWYNMVINYSKTHGGIQLHVWRIDTDEMVNKIIVPESNVVVDESGLAIGNSDINITNVRLYSTTIPVEKHRMFNTQYINMDTDKLMLVDNVDPNQVPLKLSTNYSKR